MPTGPVLLLRHLLSRLGTGTAAAWLPCGSCGHIQLGRRDWAKPSDPIPFGAVQNAATPWCFLVPWVCMGCLTLCSKSAHYCSS